MKKWLPFCGVAGTLTPMFTMHGKAKRNMYMWEREREWKRRMVNDLVTYGAPGPFRDILLDQLNLNHEAMWSWYYGTYHMRAPPLMKHHEDIEFSVQAYITLCPKVEAKTKVERKIYYYY